MTLPVKTPRPAAPQGGWSLIEVMAAIVVVGIGIALFAKVQKMTSRDSFTNSRILIAGKMIEKHLEDTRIYIAKDTVRNWPPRNKTVPAAAPDYISLVSQVSNAYSPKDGALVPNVVRMDITASWVYPTTDFLKVTTYVSKRF
ncbi:MAG TPA: prepilin-type N-terminal cleavage/methylation domain-containing protein [Fibrobacteria bacterium]|nr:prepilin-type N-terminal cleavage/methylation domain-containing protein [Fibrobacteria bacterium]